MPEPPGSTFEPTPQTSRCWTAGARRSGPSSSRSACRSRSRPRTGVDCPGSFTTETKEELMKHVELHANEAHPHLDLQPPQARPVELNNLIARLPGAHRSDDAVFDASWDPWH